MKPLNCCKGCMGLNENGTCKNKLKCLFCDDYALEQTKILYNEQKLEMGCSTCENCKHVRDYPGFITGEECICAAGLKCDTVCFTVKNCPKWIGKFEKEEEANGREEV